MSSIVRGFTAIHKVQWSDSKTSVAYVIHKTSEDLFTKVLSSDSQMLSKVMSKPNMHI